jgi:PIN domain nuclease of toxin-antitoxin system
MKLLLDTHAFLWFISGDSRLSTHAKELIEDISNERFLSVVSIWEMVIKSSIGKLVIPTPIEELVKEHVIGNDIQVFPIETAHFDTLYSLPFHHKDPFDRMMIAQAICENMSILSTDGNFPHYPVQIEW